MGRRLPASSPCRGEGHGPGETNGVVNRSCEVPACQGRRNIGAGDEVGAGEGRDELAAWISRDKDGRPVPCVTSARHNEGMGAGREGTG